MLKKYKNYYFLYYSCIIPEFRTGTIGHKNNNMPYSRRTTRTIGNDRDCGI